MARSQATGPLALAGELVDQVAGALPRLLELDERDRLLTAAWLLSLRQARTRRAYLGDLLTWRTWLAQRGVDLLAAGRVHADLWRQQQLDAGAEHTSVSRRLSALSSFPGHQPPLSER